MKRRIGSDEGSLNKKTKCNPGFQFSWILFRLSPVQVTPLIDYHWKQYSNQIESGENIKIPINPSGWFISIPNK